MPYATLDDINARYPGWLALAGPVANGVLDEDAVDLALKSADYAIDSALRRIGWDVPVVTVPVPGWIVDLAVELAVYAATTTALASADVLNDRRKRYEDALRVLDDIAEGKRIAPALPGQASGGVEFSSRERLFTRGVL